MRSESTPSTRRQALRVDVAVAAWGLGLLLVIDHSGLDLLVARQWGGPEGFAWRDHWLTARVLHDGSRVLAWMALTALAWSVWRPFGVLRELSRGRRLWLVATVLISAAFIPVLKRWSATSCPWSLAEFGGSASYVPHWLLGAVDGGPGHCFPSGHASSALAFLAVWFALRDLRPQLARRWLWGVLVGGVLLGWVQIVRGAHYPSHVLWTAWLCWVVATAMSVLLSVPGPASRSVSANEAPIA